MCVVVIAGVRLTVISIAGYYVTSLHFNNINNVCSLF